MAENETIDAEEDFLAEAQRRLEEMRATGGIPAEEVFAYLEARARGEQPPRPVVRPASD